jgi:hypothetical protein
MLSVNMECTSIYHVAVLSTVCCLLNMLSVNKIVPLFIMWPVLSMYVASVTRVVCEHGMVPMFIMSPV